MCHWSSQALLHMPATTKKPDCFRQLKQLSENNGNQWKTKKSLLTQLCRATQPPTPWKSTHVALHPAGQRAIYESWHLSEMP